MGGGAGEEFGNERFALTELFFQLSPEAGELVVVIGELALSAAVISFIRFERVSIGKIAAGIPFSFLIISVIRSRTTMKR